MILALLLAGQAASAVPVLNDDTQLSCTLIGPGDRAATTLDLDWRSKKQANAVLAFSADSPFLRVGSTSAAARRADGASVIGFDTGNGQFRLELTPQAGAVRARVTRVIDRTTRLTVAQGFCAARGGRKLRARPAPVLAVDDGVAARPWRLTPIPGRLPDATCRVVARDRSVGELGYQIAQAQKNEINVGYRFAAPGVPAPAALIGSGTQFYLVAPAERLVATTVGLGVAAPATYVHITYERMGNFVDLSRGGEVLAVGECGMPLPWLAAPAGASQ